MDTLVRERRSRVRAEKLPLFGGLGCCHSRCFGDVGLFCPENCAVTYYFEFLFHARLFAGAADRSLQFEHPSSQQHLLVWKSRPKWCVHVEKIVAI